jgi:AhpD family alkylhydroperoxidase
MLKKVACFSAAAIAVLSVLAPISYGAEKTKPNTELTSALADIEKTMGFVPEFLRALPDEALPGTWEEMKGLQLNPKSALPPKIKELIGLAVAAQVPCRYCIQAHTEFAKMNGATQTEVGEAVAMAGLTRHWSTFINGIQADEGKFRMEVQMSLDRMQMTSAQEMQKMKPVKVTDAKSALAEAAQMLGPVPEFIRKFPEVGIQGAWVTERDVEMNPNTALNPKYKSLISLAVAAQIPCKYCIISDVEFAKAAGATEAEINEAIAMASFTREMSTMLNGMQVSETKFMADLARMVKGTAKADPPPAGVKSEREKMRTP